MLKESLPVINNSIRVLLKDLCDFEFSLELDENNCIIPYIIKEGGYKNKVLSLSGYESTMSALALRSALAYKEIDKAIVVVDSLAIETNKTKDMKAILNSLKIADKKVLMVVEELNDNLIMATRNLANIVLLETSEINTLDVISADVMLITKAAAEKIGEVLV